MTQTVALGLAREAVLMVLLLAGPPLVVAMVVGLAISIFQATTQIQDQMITFVPRIIAVFVTLAVTAGWLGTILLNFTTRLFEQIPNLAR
ncbi:MAG: flagellar biosynthesis protein FliQ [Firmicutes bacterium]|nr:flagellar biosynthesis protein FliQ [Bacillota bacterium]